ncbi:general stress protein [Microbacterium sp. lyk4-40-TSB-66]|uniref:general stress protein n=1 Tax=Microbacterium sp. lyk4-40-TSB-66 TaxID=3040294 RepID=UPI00254B08B3|nr:general stress protein [Microbacterium sp. lyk4-40-TSB-66]
MSDVTRATPERRILSSFSDYTGAQAAVDRLSDAGFPVEHTAIVGHDVRIVEQVTGRMTRGRAAGLGAASGAWFGLMIGVLIGLLSPGGFLGLLLMGLVLGAVWGAVFGFAGHAFTGGRRDFSSVQGFEAERWDVTVDAEHFSRAQSLLSSGAAGETRP